MAQVTFRPDGVVATAPAGETLFEIGRRNGVPIPTSCAGKASCGLCRVRVVAGETFLTPPGELSRALKLTSGA